MDPIYVITIEDLNSGVNDALVSPRYFTTRAAAFSAAKAVGAETRELIKEFHDAAKVEKAVSGYVVLGGTYEQRDMGTFNTLAIITVETLYAENDPATVNRLGNDGIEYTGVAGALTFKPVMQ